MGPYTVSWCPPLCPLSKRWIQSAPLQLSMQWDTSPSSWSMKQYLLPRFSWEFSILPHQSPKFLQWTGHSDSSSEDCEQTQLKNMSRDIQEVKAAVNKCCPVGQQPKERMCWRLKPCCNKNVVERRNPCRWLVPRSLNDAITYKIDNQIMDKIFGEHSPAISQKWHTVCKFGTSPSQ